jgi:hypothetical protein
MRRAAGDGPLTLNFDSIPLNLTEAAISFDMDQEGACPGGSTGCGFSAIPSPFMSTCQVGRIIPGAGMCVNELLQDIADIFDLIDLLLDLGHFLHSGKTFGLFDAVFK